MIRCISLWEPWAALMWRGLKTFETRDWDRNPAPGLCAIQAAKKKFDPDDYEPEFIEQLEADGIDWKHDLGYGHVGAIVDFTKFHRTESIRDHLSRRELLYGNYGDGRQAWESKMVRRLETPIPLVGHQGLFGWAEGDRYVDPAYVPSPNLASLPLFGGLQ